MISCKTSIGIRSFFFKKFDELVLENKFFFKIGGAVSECRQFFLCSVCKSDDMITQFIRIVLKEIILENDRDPQQKSAVNRMTFEHVADARPCLIEATCKFAYRKALLSHTLPDPLPDMNAVSHRVLTVKIIEPDGSSCGHRSIYCSL